MSNKVHARFQLNEDARASYYHYGKYTDAARIKLFAVKGEPFGPATPQGTIDMFIVNPEAVEVFRNAPIGQEYDVVFTTVKKAEDEQSEH
jgi:hypothetical protein